MNGSNGNIVFLLLLHLIPHLGWKEPLAQLTNSNHYHGDLYGVQRYFHIYALLICNLQPFISDLGTAGTLTFESVRAN